MPPTEQLRFVYPGTAAEPTSAPREPTGRAPYPTGSFYQPRLVAPPPWSEPARYTRPRSQVGHHPTAISRPFLGMGTSEERSSLVELGAALLDDLLDGRPLTLCQLPPVDQARWLAMTTAAISLAEGLALVLAELEQRVRSGTLKAGSVTKFASYAARMVRFLEGSCGFVRTVDVETMHLQQYVDARNSRTLESPARSTRRNRAWTAGLYFRSLIDLGIQPANPATGLHIGRGEATSVRPLTDEEEQHCRRHSARSLRDTRGPAAWALARATALAIELSSVLAADVDLTNAKVWLTGSGSRAARWGYLDNWDVEAIRSRIDALSLEPYDSLVYEGTGSPESMGSSASQAIQEICKRAGLGGDRRVRASSVPAWRGRHLFEATGDIEHVRGRLGVGDWETARRVIGISLSPSDKPPLHRQIPQ